jgi:hypothetical protein
MRSLGPLTFPPGDYRIELTDRHGKKTDRRVHLTAEGFDLRVR